MNNPSLIKRATDNLRTAPYALGMTGFELGVTAFVMAEGSRLSDVLAIPTGAFGVVLGGLVAAKQFRLRHRLENSIERVGYSDRVMDPTTKTWCNRQTARVVCANAGYLDEYVALCERRSETAALNWLPHI